MREKKPRPDGSKLFRNPERINVEFGYVDFYPVCNNPYNVVGYFEWGAKGVGFGEMTLYKMEDGTHEIDSEHESRDFVRQMMNYFVDNLKFRDGKDASN